MSYRLIVRPEVDADLLEAEAWYEQQHEGLGCEFLRDARDAIDNLSGTRFVHIAIKCVGPSRTGFPTALFSE